MDITADLVEFQAEANSRMRDTCTVTVPSSEPGVPDPVTWLEPASAGTLVYSGPCRLRMGGTVAGSSQATVAGDRVSTSTPTLSLPVSAPRVPVGAVVLITAVPADDPAGHLRLGLRLRVVGLVLGTDMTAQRLTVEAVTG
jgi:hypothetical protein